MGKLSEFLWVLEFYLGYGWVITSYTFIWNWLFIHALNSMLLQLIYGNKSPIVELNC